MTKPTLAYGEGSWDYLLRTWQEMDVPEGYRAEIREGGIFLMPPPDCPHNSIADRIQRQLYRQIPDDWAIHQKSGVAFPELLRLRVPDLVIVEAAAVPLNEGLSLDSADVKLAVEIVSPSSIRTDRREKRDDYARSGIPLFLLVDPFDKQGTVTRFMAPRDGVFADVHRSEFGEPIMLPKPFGKINTFEFPRPE